MRDKMNDTQKKMLELITQQNWTPITLIGVMFEFLEETNNLEGFYEYCLELVEDLEGETTSEELASLLDLVMENSPSPEEIELWTDEQRLMAEEWAVSVHIANEQ